MSDGTSLNVTTTSGPPATQLQSREASSSPSASVKGETERVVQPGGVPAPPGDAHILAGYEIGYDRHYIGAALHCRRCTAGDEYHDIDSDIDKMSVADVVRLAIQHEIDHHSGGPHGTTSQPTGI